jgi:hypothetical protein
MIFNDNEQIYFNQEISNGTGEFEKLCFIINDKKIKIYDCNNNIKISIKKKIKPESKKGSFILFYLGYDNKDYKIIIKCSYSKSKSCYNTSYQNYLFIITCVLEKGPKILYKYRLHKDKIIYDNTLIQKMN